MPAVRRPPDPSTAVAASPPDTRTARELYEQIVEELLAEASLGAGAIAGVVGEVRRAAAECPTARCATGSRASASARWPATSATATPQPSSGRWPASIGEESAADNPKPAEAIPADVAVRYVRELPETWRKAEGGTGRQLLASALFSRIEVLGIREATVHLSAHAVRHGLAAALPAELRILVNGRGERI